MFITQTRHQSLPESSVDNATWKLSNGKIFKTLGGLKEYIP